MTIANFKQTSARSQNGNIQAPGKISKLANGFTLVELLIVIAIVGIVASIGYPSYLDYIKKTRRADLTVSDQGDYAISLETTSTTYVITATAQNKQASDDKCPTMLINDKGQQTFTGDGPCW